MSGQNQSVAAIVRAILESLSDSISQLLLLAVTLQEANAAPPDALKPAVAGVDQAANTLVQVARAVATDEYQEQDENIYTKLNRAAELVEKASAALVRATTALYSEPDRAKGWGVVVKACKTMSAKTIHMLELVYSAELERLFRAKDECYYALDELKPRKAQYDPHALAREAGEVATQANQLAAFLRQKAADEESPVLKAELEAVAERLEKGAQALLDDVNELLRDPNSEPKRHRVEDSIKDLKDAIKAANSPLKAVASSYDDLFGAERLAPMVREYQDDNVGRAEGDLFDIKDRMLREEDAQQDGAKKNNFDAADAANDELARLKPELDRKANKWAAIQDEPTRRKLKNDLADLDDLLKRQREVTAAARADPSSREKKEDVEDIGDLVYEKLHEIGKTIDPNEEFRRQIADTKRHADKLGDDAAIGDAPSAAGEARKANKGKGRVGKQGKSIASAVENPERKRALEKALDKLDDVMPAQQQAAGDALRDPSNQAKLDDLAAKNEEVKKALDDLAAAAKPTWEEQVMQNTRNQQGDLPPLADAARSGDPSRVDDVLDDLENQNQDLHELLKKEPDNRVLQDAQREMERLLPKVRDAARAAAKDPKNRDGHAALKDVADDYDAELKKIQDHLRKRQQQGADPDDEKAKWRDMKDRLKQLAADVDGDLHNLKADPKDANAQGAMQQRLDDVDSCLGDLDGMLPIEQAALATIAQERADVRDTTKAADDEHDPEKTKKATKALDATNNKLGDQVRTAAQRADPKNKRTLETAMNNLDELMGPAERKAAALAAASPDDVGKQLDYHDTKARINNNLDALENALGGGPNFGKDLLDRIKTQNELLDEILDKAKRGDVAGTDNAIKRLGPVNAELRAMIAEEAERTNDPRRADELRDFVKRNDEIMARLVPDAKKSAANPTDKAARAALEKDVKDMKDLWDEVADKTHAKLLSDLKDQEANIARLEDGAAAGSAPQVTAAAKDVADTQKRIADGVAKLAAGERDPAKKAAAEAAAARMAAELPGQVQAARDVLANPSDRRAMDKLRDANAHAREPLAVVENVARPDPFTDLKKAVRQHEDDVATMMDAVRAGDAAKVDEQLKKIDARHKDVQRLGKAAADNAVSGGRRREINAALDDFEKSMSALPESAKAALSSPDAYNKTRVLQDEMRDAGRRLLDNAEKDLIDQAKGKAAAAARGLRDEPSNVGKGQALLDHLNDLADRADERCKLLDWDAVGVERGVTPNAAKPAAAKRRGGGATAKRAGDKPEAIEPMDFDSLGDKGGKFDDKLGAVAANINKMLKPPRPRPDFDIDPLVILCRKIGTQIETFAGCAKTDDRQGLIKTGREIDATIKQLKVELDKLILETRDPVMRDTLIRAGTALRNMGTQLKILASVKAASSGIDPESENQIVSITSNIGKNLGHCINGIMTVRIARKA